MAHRDIAPVGAPCWVDLWTSDVEGSRTFYSELFGWTAEEPSPEFGGYFIFSRDGVPTAGGMGDMGDLPADNTWKVYLATDDLERTIKDASDAGAQIAFPAMAVADLGSQSILVDPTGATVGVWQPDTFQGFTTLDEPGAPGWFELHTRDYATAVDFYRSVFKWTIEMMSDTDEFRYSTMRDPAAEGQLAGIMDSNNFLPEGVGAHWRVYFRVGDTDKTVEAVKSLGGTLVMDIHDTPYGRLAVVADPAGAQFSLLGPSA